MAAAECVPSAGQELACAVDAEFDTRPPVIEVADKDVQEVKAGFAQLLKEEKNVCIAAAAEGFVDDAVICRYLVAKKQDATAAAAGIVATLHWRAATIPTTLHCEVCEKDKGSHCFEFIGHDRFGRPVIYGCPTRAKTLDTDPTVQHVVSCLEAAFTHPASSDTWVWVTDFNGYGLWDAMSGTGLASAFATTFSAHFPERLGAVLLVDPPGAFGILLSVVRAVVEARTINKVVEVAQGTHDERMATLRSMLGPGPVCDWLDIALQAPLDTDLPPMPQDFKAMREWRGVQQTT